jgi:hypothetical protein
VLRREIGVHTSHPARGEAGLGRRGQATATPEKLTQLADQRHTSLLQHKRAAEVNRAASLQAPQGRCGKNSLGWGGATEICIRSIRRHFLVNAPGLLPNATRSGCASEDLAQGTSLAMVIVGFCVWLDGVLWVDGLLRTFARQERERWRGLCCPNRDRYQLSAGIRGLVDGVSRETKTYPVGRALARGDSEKE